MNLAIVLVIAATLALVLVLGAAAKRTLLVTRKGSEFARTIQPIDLEAFRNLIDPSEDEYLRRRLPAAHFRAVRRERLRATAAYVHVVAANAAVLVRAGEAALASGDARFAMAAHQLVNEALLLRRNATLALIRIYAALVWPGSDSVVKPVADRYENLSSAAMRLGRLQNPAVPVRLSVSL
jgi:hypothetical protein